MFLEIAIAGAAVVGSVAWAIRPKLCKICEVDLYRNYAYDREFEGVKFGKHWLCVPCHEEIER